MLMNQLDEECVEALANATIGIVMGEFLLGSLTGDLGPCSPNKMLPKVKEVIRKVAEKNKR